MGTKILTADRAGPGAALMKAVAFSAAVTAALLAPTAAHGDELSDIPGAFADVGIGAGPMGMCGAVSASVRGAQALFWNPAGLRLTDHAKEATVTYGDQMGLVPYTAGAGLLRLGDYALAAGVLYSGDDALSETTILLAASREIPLPQWAPGPLSAGATVRTRMASFGHNESAGEQVEGSALGFGLDAGLLLPITGTTTVAVSARDVVNTLSWDSSAAGSYSEGVPPALTFGVAMRPHPDLLLEADLDKSLHVDSDDLVRAGAELRLFAVAFLRGGYSTRPADSDSDEYSAGAGAVFPAGTTTMSLDVAYVFGRLDDTLRLSLGVGL